MGLYFEEFIVGQEIITGKADHHRKGHHDLCPLTGDDNRIHTDPEFSKTTIFGRQVAHGLLGLSIASGLAWQTGILDGTVLAFREVNEWKFIKPVFIGDTIDVKLQIKEVKAMSRIGGGAVTIGVGHPPEQQGRSGRPAWTPGHVVGERPADPPRPIRCAHVEDRDAAPVDVLSWM